MFLSGKTGPAMTTLAPPRENLKYTKPWLYYKSGVEFLNDFWPMSPIETDERLLYGPGHVQRMLKRFAEIAEQSMDSRRGRSDVSHSRRLRSADDLPRSNSTTFSPSHRHSSCPTVSADISTTPSSVQQLKRKFEYLSSASAVAQGSSKPKSRNTAFDRMDKANSPGRPTTRRSSEMTTSSTSNSSSYCLTDVFGDASYLSSTDRDESSTSESTTSKYAVRKPTKKITAVSLAKGVPYKNHLSAGSIEVILQLDNLYKLPYQPL
ncbi:hypothetical protein D918_06174 [Trichuris suis]|nr:hypothetical protein D918_06174 [Trichuris suis]